MQKRELFLTIPPNATTKATSMSQRLLTAFFLGSIKMMTIIIIIINIRGLIAL